MIGKALIVIGIIIALIGVIFTVAPKLPFLGRLPGDIIYKKANFTVYFPLTTSIIISVLLSVIFYFISKR
ncbi:DUF2905 domain-containing protein [bacterium]|nr:MAG: DUF2905 domain-containing protein [bacterium]